MAKPPIGGSFPHCREGGGGGRLGLPKAGDPLAPSEAQSATLARDRGGRAPPRSGCKPRMGTSPGAGEGHRPGMPGDARHSFLVVVGGHR
ncbi:hypothetical protein NL676_016155 [Syzygium grande]|nr:hypothetical protein NL676_016155 [Syzygium grande]